MRLIFFGNVTKKTASDSLYKVRVKGTNFLDEIVVKKDVYDSLDVGDKVGLGLTSTIGTISATIVAQSKKNET